MDLSPAVVLFAGSLVIFSPLVGLFGAIEAFVFMNVLPLHHQ
jgi:hypothetical protein